MLNDNLSDEADAYAKKCFLMNIGKFKVCMNDYKSMKKTKNVIILGFFKSVLIEQHLPATLTARPAPRCWG